MYHYTFSGLKNVWVDGIVEYVDDVGEPCIEIPKCNSLSHTILEMVTHKDGSLNGDEVKVLRTAYGKTQQQLADLFGVHIRTVSRWETGAHPIDNANDLRLRWLVAKQRLGIKVATEIMATFADKVLHPKEVKYHINIADLNKATG